MNSGTGAGRLAAAAMLAASAVMLGTGWGAAQGRVACGEQLYTVRPGDSLSLIAQRAYSSFNYQVIFDANRNVLTNPAILVVGQQIFVPCLDGSGPASKAEVTGAGNPPAEAAAAAAAAETGVRRLQAPATAARPEDETVLAASSATATDAVPALDRPVRFLTGSDFAPFTHRDLPEGGMLTDIVNRAMLRADALRPYDITWENDWSLHLSTLLPEGKHDLGFPWYKPDCSVLQKLSEAMRKRCTDYDFSKPLYEVVVGYYLPADAPEIGASEHSVLFGRRLCRPAGYFTFDLEAADLVAPNVEMVRPASPGDCFRMLADGTVDVVTLNVLLGEREIAESGLEGRIVEAAELASIQTLHVLSPKSNPYGRSYLSLIDRGLAQLRDEGIWFEITSRHLAEHAKNL